MILEVRSHPSVVTMWCRATSKLRFQMFSATFLNLSMKSLSNFSFSYQMFTNVMYIKWCN